MTRRTNDQMFPYEATLDFCNWLKNVDKATLSPDRLCDMWHGTFVCVAAYLGFHKRGRRVLWEGMRDLNWRRLWPTEDEKAKPLEEMLHDLRYEVFYCSDRWSVTRLQRCNWLELLAEHRLRGRS